MANLPATIFGRLERKSVDLRRHRLSSKPRERGMLLYKKLSGKPTKNWPDEIESRSDANNPKGIPTSSPRLRGTSYLGKTSKQNDNRNAVAAMSRGSCSVPNVFFIPFDFVLAQKQAQLILKTHLTMMLLLIGDVLLHLFEIRLADAKVCVASLPLEVGEIASAFLQPEVGDAFQLLYPFCLRDGTPESREQMHVVFHSPGESGRTIELSRDTAEIRVERVARGFVAQKRTTVFGGEDEMNVNGGKGLWHVERMVSRVLVCQSQRIASIRRRLARRLRPWVGVRKEPQRQRRCGRAQVRGRNARVATALRLGRFLADDPG